MGPGFRYFSVFKQNGMNKFSTLFFMFFLSITPFFLLTHTWKSHLYLVSLCSAPFSIIYSKIMQPLIIWNHYCKQFLRGKKSLQLCLSNWTVTAHHTAGDVLLERLGI